MAVARIINDKQDEHQFSFEVLPPLKGTGTDKLFADIEKLCELNPAFIKEPLQFDCFSFLLTLFVQVLPTRAYDEWTRGKQQQSLLVSCF
jgi:hypothetical protein